MDSAEAIMRRLAPLLTNWLQENLRSHGFLEATANSGEREEHPSKRSGRDEKGTKKPAPSAGRAPGATGTNEGGKYTTIMPNPELWSTVTGRNSGRRKSLPAASTSAAPLQTLSLSNRRRTRD